MISYELSPDVSDDELNELFAAAWEPGLPGRFVPAHEHALVHICAYEGDRLIGYVRAAWDGSQHAFLLEPTVHPDFQHRGIGRELVSCALGFARERGVEWMHVDFEEELRPFYEACGFRHTPAGLVDLRSR